MSEPRDLTGIWYGRYDAALWPETNSFIAVLEERGGALTGTITEPDTEGQVPIRRAAVHGQRFGASVTFVKQYDGTGGHVHAIHYDGRIDGAGREVRGQWSQSWGHGSFVMEREKFDAAALEEDEAEAELTPVDAA